MVEIHLSRPEGRWLGGLCITPEGLMLVNALGISTTIRISQAPVVMLRFVNLKKKH